MAFDTSTIENNIDTGDSHKFVVEKHTYNGEDFYYRYEAGSGADVNALLSSHATSFWDALVEAELIEVIDG